MSNINGQVLNLKPSGLVNDIKPISNQVSDIKPKLANIDKSSLHQLRAEIISKGQYMGIPGLTYPEQFTVITAELP